MRWTVGAFGLASVLFFAASSSAHAAKYRFGLSESLNHIQDLDRLKGPSGEALYLGYKTSTQNFLLPYWMTDDGYIVGVKGQDRFYRIEPDRLKELQDRGQLPSPLPPYEISGLDWFFGHLAWAILGGLALWGGWSAYSSSRNRKAEAMVAEADVHANEGRLDQAITGYSTAIKTSPKLIRAYHNRAFAFEQKGDYDKAIADHTTVIRLAPKAADAFLMRASANQRKGDHERAISDFSSVIRKDPSHVLAYLGRAVSRRQKGELDASIADCNTVIELAPGAAIGYATRADALDLIGSADRAAADLAAADRATAYDLEARATAPSSDAVPHNAPPGAAPA